MTTYPLYYAHDSESVLDHENFLAAFSAVINQSIAGVISTGTNTAIQMTVGATAATSSQFTVDSTQLVIGLTDDGSQIQIMDELYPLDVVVDSAATSAITAAVITALGITNPIGILALTIAGITGFAYSAFLDDLVESELSTLDGTDMVQFFNSEGQERGLVFPDGIPGTELEAIKYFMNHAQSSGVNLLDGHFQLETEVGFDNVYQVYDASSFQTIADNLGITLDEFLSAGEGVNNNLDKYDANLNKVIIQQHNNILVQDNAYTYIPVKINGEVQNIGVELVQVGDVIVIGDESLASENNPKVLKIGVDGSFSMVISSYNDGIDTQDIIIGTDGVNNINYRTGGNDIIAAMGGDDVVNAGYGYNVVDGGDGSDTIDYSFLGFGDGDLVVNLAENSAVSDGILHITQDTLYNIENVIGSAGDDEIIGDANDNSFEGGEGDDELDGGVGNDTYIFNGIYDKDTVTDSDKQGQIVINGKTLTGTASILDEHGSGSYLLSVGGNGYRLTVDGADLKIVDVTDSNNSGGVVNEVTIKNFNSGDLGIALDDGSDPSGPEVYKLYSGTEYDDNIYVPVTPDLEDPDNALVTAGPGHDTINTHDGDDLIYAGDGDDTIQYGRGSDKVFAGQGNDFISGHSSVADSDFDVIDGQEGNDIIYAYGDGDLIYGGSGNDAIHHYGLESTINSGIGDDFISADGSDRIRSNTTYIFNEGDGNDTIEDKGGTDKIVFGEDITVDDISLIYTLTSGQHNLVIQYSDDASDQITILDAFNTDFTDDDENYLIEMIEFNDGSFIDLQYNNSLNTPNPLPLEFYGTDGADAINMDQYSSSYPYFARFSEKYVEAGAGDDIIAVSTNGVINAGTGNDFIYNLNGSYDGDITYIFNKGDGQDSITDNYGNDTIKFGDEIAEDDIIFVKSGNHLNVRFLDSDDQITITNHFTGYGIENFELHDGTVIDSTYSISEETGSVGNDYLYFYDNNVSYYVDSKEGDDYIRTADGDDIIIAGDGDDELDARAGNNTLTGGEGSDIFVITKTASAARLTAQTTSPIETDTITDFDLSAQGDKIDLSDFSTRIYFSELNIYQDGNNAIIDFGNQQVILENIDYTQLNQTHFTGILQEHEIHAGVLDDVIEDYRVDGASYYDSYRIYGYDGDDIINGITGRNNVIDGGAGNDILITRDATLTGGEGSDIFKFSYFVDEYQNSNNVITDFDVSDPNEKIVLEATDITDFSQLSITDSAQGAVITYTAYNYWGFYDATNSITLQGVSASDLTADHFEISTLVDTSGSGEYVDYSSYNTPFHTSGYGGSGTVLTGSGEDFVYIEDGSYDIDSGAGNDTIYSWGGNDTIYSGTGDDEIILTYSSSSHIMTVHGQEDNDHFYIDSSSYGFHELHGGQGADSFELHANNAQINGDAGDDLINLYDGTNVVVNAGGDHDVVNVYADAQGSIISGDAGNDLFVIRSTDNSSTIVDFEIDNPNEKIDFQFLDITYADLQITQSGADAVISYTGFSGNVILTDTDATQLTQDNFIFKHTGTNVDDTITTNNYNNVIAADDGKDTITISGMENEIAGGTGDDQFIITKLAKSQTTITDFDVDNTNETIDLSQFEVSSVSDLYIYNKDNDAYVNLGNEQVLILKNVTKEALRDANFIFNTNTAPIINNPIADQENKSNNIFNFAIAADAFIDADGDSLTYSATLADGSSLPDWLSFNAETQTFTGTPPSSLIDSALSLMITADDGLLQTSQVFNLTITSNIIEGTNANDNFRGTIDNDELYGLAGNDVIRGARGNDKIFGGDGRDHLIGGGDADELHGGNGRDLLKGNKGNDKLYGGMGKDSLFGGNGHDELYGQEADDLLIGNHGQDILHGGAGNDDIRGGKHQDHLYGQEGNDTLRGGKGSDHINGGQGQDILIGGNGHDFFVFDSLSHSNSLHPDIIKDFQQTKDLIDLSNLGFDGITNDDSQTDDSLLTYTHNGNNTIIENEDQTFAITMKGIFELDSDDFFFS